MPLNLATCVGFVLESGPLCAPCSAAQRHHVGSFKWAMVGAFTLWQSADATGQGSPLHLPLSPSWPAHQSATAVYFGVLPSLVNESIQ